jgi:hypothetical protein
MLAKSRSLLAAALVGAFAAPAVGQPPPPAPVPPPADPGPPPPAPGPPTATPLPGQPAPTAATFPAVRPGPAPDAGVECLPSNEGLFFGVDLDFLKPHVKNRLSGTVTFPGGSTATVRTTEAPLDWTVAPAFELGYRFGEDFGELSARYRFLNSEGDTTGPSFFGPADFRSRLALNQFDFDYASAHVSPGPFWDLKYRVGARLETVFFDSAAHLGDVASQSASDYFVGAGPHFGIDAERRFGLVDGLAAFGRADGAVLVGQVRQRFHENVGAFAGNFTQQGTQSVPVLTLEAGLSYTPPRMEFIHFTTGYEFEQLWGLGRLHNSRGDLTDQGVFLRGEFDY